MEIIGWALGSRPFSFSIVSLFAVCMDEDAFELSWGIYTLAPVSGELIAVTEDYWSTGSLAWELDPPVRAG